LRFGYHQHCGSEGERGRQRHQHAERGGQPQGLEVGQPGEAQAVHRPGDGQSRADDHVHGAAEHRVVRRFTLLACPTRFVISPDDEDRVVGTRGDRQQREQIGRVGRQADDSRVRQKGDHPSGSGQLDEDRQQHDDHRDDRAVDEQQHDRDDQEGDHGDLFGALVADLEVVGDQR
jgi:hypothetical protein